MSKLEISSCERNGDECRLVFKVDGVGQTVDFNRREKTKGEIIAEVKKRYEETTVPTSTNAASTVKRTASTKSK